jgi:hypothetical protein
MQQLLQPYFHRVRFNKQQKKVWFVDRSGVLFGFSAAFAVMIKIPLLGVLMYGIAEASTAYLITKITNLPLGRLDEFNAKLTGVEERGLKGRLSQTPGKRFS